VWKGVGEIFGCFGVDIEIRIDVSDGECERSVSRGGMNKWRSGHERVGMSIFIYI